MSSFKLLSTDIRGESSLANFLKDYLNGRDVLGKNILTV